MGWRRRSGGRSWFAGATWGGDAAVLLPAMAVTAALGLASSGCAGPSAATGQRPAPVPAAGATASAVPARPLPEVAAGETCGGVEVTLDRGGLLPPLRFSFAAGDATPQVRDAYAVETRVADYNAQRCWVAVRVTRPLDDAFGDVVLKPMVGTTEEATVTVALDGFAGSQAGQPFPTKTVASPDMKDPFGSPHPRSLALSSLPRPTKRGSSPDLCDPFGTDRASCGEDRAEHEGLSVVVTVHRPGF